MTDKVMSVVGPALQEAFDKHALKKATAKKKTKEERDASRSASMTMDEMDFGMKKGGVVSKADMQKAGFYDKGRTKSERQKIVSKVTTKPQRVAIVEKAFSTKNMKSGGIASKRADGCAVKGKTRGRMI